MMMGKSLSLTRTLLSLSYRKIFRLILNPKRNSTQTAVGHLVSVIVSVHNLLSMMLATFAYICGLRAERSEMFLFSTVSRKYHTTILMNIEYEISCLRRILFLASKVKRKIFCSSHHHVTVWFTGFVIGLLTVLFHLLAFFASLEPFEISHSFCSLLLS